MRHRALRRWQEDDSGWVRVVVVSSCVVALFLRCIWSFAELPDAPVTPEELISWLPGTSVWHDLIRFYPSLMVLMAAFVAWNVLLSRRRTAGPYAGPGLVLASIGYVGREFGGYTSYLLDPIQASVGNNLFYLGTAAFLIGMALFVADMFFAWRRRRRNRGAKINVSVFE